MSLQFFLPWPFLSILCILLMILFKIQPTLSHEDIIRSCHLPFRCGNITADFPFWGGFRQQYCGHPKLKLLCDQKNTTTMTMGDVNYRVLNVGMEEQVLRIARQDYFDGLCPHNNTTIDEELFYLSDGYDALKLLFYGCPKFNPGQFTCYLKDATNYWDGRIHKGDNMLPGCNYIVDFLVSKTLLEAAKWDKTVLEEALEKGFEVKWKVNPCDKKCKSCGYDMVKKNAICYCSDGRISDSTGCPDSSGTHLCFQKLRWVGNAFSSSIN